jgi:NitT/TauT family transport system ATP-binding protein
MLAQVGHSLGHGMRTDEDRPPITTDQPPPDASADGPDDRPPLPPLAVATDKLDLIYPTAGGPVHALAGIDLAIRQGEFVSFIGPSGCGKTTLLRVIADLEHATGGAITVNGVTPEQARLARAYGFVFQAAALYPWRNVLRNVTLPLEIQHMPRAERLARAEQALAQVELSSFARRFPWHLSGGMQQRVSIARALSFDPALLLMDEPFGALDEIIRDRLNEQLLALWRRTGKTVLFVTHSIQEAVFLSSRIIVMSPRPGRIIDDVPCDLPPERGLEIRDSPAFARIAHRVRAGLHAGHSDEL